MDDIVWKPKSPNTTQMAKFMRFVCENHQVELHDYHALHQWSVKEVALFWDALRHYFNVKFDSNAKQVLSPHKNMLNAKWFEGARFNYAQKLLLRDDNHPAIVAINEENIRREISYKTLKEKVAQCAAGLKKAGVTTGDRVAAILPNWVETIIAFLATSSIGAIWSSCSPDFGIEAAVDRLGQVEPKILFTCDGHQYQGKYHDDLKKIPSLIANMPSIEQVIVCSLGSPAKETQKNKNIMAWENFLIESDHLEFASLPFDHPLYILFSSGTTGKPKCIVHGTGGVLLQHMKELGLHTDITQEDNLFFYTTCGWMMWNWMVSALSLGTTITLYEGSPTYPDINRLFQIINQEKVSVFGTSAKYLSTIEKSNAKPNNQYPLDALRCILSTGSPLLPKNYDFVYSCIKPDVQLSSISGGTDIVSCFALGNPILPVYRGELQCIGLGMDVEIFDEHGQPVIEEKGELVCTQAFPSMPIGFWQDEGNKKYFNAYFSRFPGVWAHGDYAKITQHYGLVIYGRSDTVLNPGGVRIGTAEIYRQVEKVAEVIDSVVIGQEWRDDVRVILFVKLQPNLKLEASLDTKIKQMIRTHASPRHVPAKIIQVPDIPRTISGKVVELAVRDVVQGREVSNLKSLANPEALNYFIDIKELKK